MFNHKFNHKLNHTFGHMLKHILKPQVVFDGPPHHQARFLGEGTGEAWTNFDARSKRCRG